MPAVSGDVRGEYMVEKEFGRLSLPQIKQLVVMLQGLRPERKELARAAKADQKYFIRNAPSHFSWAEFYRLSLSEVIALLVIAGGIEEPEF